MTTEAEILEIAEFLNTCGEMHSFAKRIKTFEENDWPHEDGGGSLTAEKMADAGFYMLQGTEDSVMCYYCLRTLEGWEPEDEPWEEHKRRPCQFIKKGKLARTLTVKDAMELESTRTKTIVEKKLNDIVDNYRKEAEKVKKEIVGMGKTKTRQRTTRRKRN